MTSDTLGLTDREAWTLLGMSRSRFYVIKPALKPHAWNDLTQRWSRELLVRFMATPSRRPIAFGQRRPA